MAAIPELSGISICERDHDDDFMFVWVYPSLEVNTKELILRKCEILSKEHQSNDFCFNQTCNKWYYIKKSDRRNDDLKFVAEVYVVIMAQDFNPELYEELAKICLSNYQKEFSTSPVLNSYLSLYTKGVCTKENGTKLSHVEYDKKKAYMNTCVKALAVGVIINGKRQRRLFNNLRNSPPFWIRDIFKERDEFKYEMITLFGMESILIYMAALLKKRIAVYCEKLSTLHHVCRSIPAFVLHRLDWSIVHPFVHFDENEMNELKSQRSYVAGFTNAEVENKNELYDIFLNVSDGEIVLNPQSKEFFQMGKMHKEIAKYLVQSSEDDDLADEDIVRELTRKTKDIISNLKSLDDEDDSNPQISLEMLRSRNLTSVMQSFLFNLASAEGIVKL